MSIATIATVAMHLNQKQPQSRIEHLCTGLQSACCVLRHVVRSALGVSSSNIQVVRRALQGGE